MTTRQLPEPRTQFYLCNRDRFDGADREVLWEVVRRVEQHERLISEVLPDVRSRRTALEQAATALLPNRSCNVNRPCNAIAVCNSLQASAMQL
jgi:hypothetical protein